MRLGFPRHGPYNQSARATDRRQKRSGGRPPLRFCLRSRKRSPSPGRFWRQHKTLYAEKRGFFAPTSWTPGQRFGTAAMISPGVIRKDTQRAGSRRDEPRKPRDVITHHPCPIFGSGIHDPLARSMAIDAETVIPGQGFTRFTRTGAVAERPSKDRALTAVPRHRSNGHFPPKRESGNIRANRQPCRRVVTKVKVRVKPPVGRCRRDPGSSRAGPPSP